VGGTPDVPQLGGLPVSGKDVKISNFQERPNHPLRTSSSLRLPQNEA